MRGELDARDKQLGDTVAEIEKLREDQHLLKGEVKDRGSAIVTLQTELEKVRGEVVEKELAIANLKAELEAAVMCEAKPKPPEQMELFPTEPIPEQLQPVPKVRVKGKGKTQKLPAVDKVKTESEPVGTNGTKLLNAKQLAERINTTYSPPKPVNDHNLRDWYKPDSTCSDSHRAKMEGLYHYRFSHQDAKKAYWFEILPEG